MTNRCYFVVMMDIEPHGLEAIVDPNITRAEVIRRIDRLEYNPDNIVFIHDVHDGICKDVTEEIRDACDIDFPRMSPSDRLAALHDHNRKIRNESR